MLRVYRLLGGWRRWALLAGVVALAVAYWVMFVQPRTTEVGAEVPVALQVLMVRPNNPSFAVVDLEERAVTEYPPGGHAMPRDAVDGAVITPRLDTIIWADGTARLFSGRLDSADAELRPDPLRRLGGVAPSLYVVPAVDGEAVWLVQPGNGSNGVAHPTLIERLELATDERTPTIELDPSSVPVAATRSGLVLNTHRGDISMSGRDGEQVLHVQHDGTVQEVGPGHAVAATPTRVIRLVCPPQGGRCEPHVSGVDGSGDRVIPAPLDGNWVTGGIGDAIPSQTLQSGAASPDGSRFLAWIRAADDGDGEPGRSTLFSFDLDDGSATELVSIDGPEPMSTWSRDGRWVVLIDQRDIRLIDTDAPGVAPLVLEGIVPSDHFPFAAG